MKSMKTQTVEWNNWSNDVKIESLKKAQTEINWKWKNVGKSNKNIRDKHHQQAMRWERKSQALKVKETDFSVNENVKS